jgi:penicillin amidase
MSRPKGKVSWRRLAAIVLGALAVPVLLILIFAGNIFFGMHAVARTDGTVSGLALHKPVSILRDARGIPHIRASDEHDLFFAQGYVEASDRLFQMDLTRRYITGTLAEVLGGNALASDEGERAIPIAQMVAAQWAGLPQRERDSLQAFSEGVNAAIEREPTPVEFRILFYHPKPWTPQDSLAVGMATVLDLTDTWDDILPRDRDWRSKGPKGFALLHPLSDPCYDSPLVSGLAKISDAPKCVAQIASALDTRAPIGSNEWAAGAAHTATGRALLANDPHLRLGIPGVWYLVDMQAPGFHVAGAAFPGTPGVVLGHNDRIAWGSTNGTVASLSVYAAPQKLAKSGWHDETFDVRFGKPVTQQYYRTATEFGVRLADTRFVLVRWDAYVHPRSPIGTFDALDRSKGLAEAQRALDLYPGPTQNFELADASGSVGYRLTGYIPNDPAWARYIHPATDLAHPYPGVPDTKLPRVAPSRNAIVWTSNNKMYAGAYPYRLSPEFAPPYRAYRVAQMLHDRTRYDLDYFRTMQLDTLSIPERDLARFFHDTNTAGWDGRVAPGSVAASNAVAERLEATKRHNQAMPRVLIANRKMPVDLKIGTPSDLKPWGIEGAVQVKHPLAALGLGWLLNGTQFPGNGDAFTVHVQTTGTSQSFRAVWDVGNWDAGGIVIPQGESGQPGSPHYTDGANDWLAGNLIALPYSPAAVQRAARARETLSP